MNLLVGIAGDPTGWDEVLLHDGIPFEQAPDAGDVSKYSVLILAESGDPDFVSRGRKVLASGGSILCSSSVFAQLIGSDAHGKRIQYLVPDDMFPGNGLIDLDIDALVPDRANALPCQDGSFSSFVGEAFGGDVIALPFDPIRIGQDQRSVVRTFWAEHRRLPFERVSTVWREGARGLITRALEILHHRRSLPFVRLWYFPRDEESMFCFRVDTDGAYRADIERIQAVAAPTEIPTTWFLDLETQHGHTGLYSAGPADEIALHCFAHRKYEAYEDAAGDISRGLDALRAAGARVHGFASPYGIWNHTIARAIEEAGFAYSSEFSCGYDGHPSYPLIGDRKSSVLQIPSHPISIGSLRRQGFRPLDMERYFASVIESSLQRRHAVVLYHHPRDEYESVLAGIFDRVRDRRIPCMTIHEYAAWWHARIQVKAKFSVHGNLCTVNAGSYPSDVSLQITRGDGTEAIVPIESQIDLSHLPWSTKHEKYALPAGIRRSRSFNPWIPIIQIEDFIYRHLRPRIWGA